jgi:hypothetical protein
VPVAPIPTPKPGDGQGPAENDEDFHPDLEELLNHLETP